MGCGTRADRVETKFSDFTQFFDVAPRRKIKNMGAVAHPTERQVYDYCAGIAGYCVTCEVEKHLADCADCRMRVVTMVPRKIKTKSTQPPDSKISSRGYCRQ